MAHVVDTQVFLDTVCDLLRQGEPQVAIPVAGNSMAPFLHHGDTVYLRLPDSPLKRGDIVLYTRSDGRYILHRIQKINKDGTFFMVGDAQQELENIPSQGQIHARACAALHHGKFICPGTLRWWAYQHIWLWVVPYRHRIMGLWAIIRRK